MYEFGDNGPGKLDQPTGCIYHENKFIVSDIGNHCLKVFDKSGKFLYKIGEKGEADGQFLFPWGLCVEKYGDHQNLWCVTEITDAFNSLQWKVVLLAKLLLS